MNKPERKEVRVKVIGVGGAGGNAVDRMSRHAIGGMEYLAVNTDVQALGRISHLPTLAIGPATTGGLGSGGNPDRGRKAIKESRDQVAQLLDGSDMVFVTAGMGGGTGTGAAPVVAELAKKQGALAVAVVTLPFSFEGDRRRELSDRGLRLLRDTVDTLIVVQNDRLLSALDGKLSLDKAFRVADEVLRQGVQGIAEIVAVPGLINVDFADVRSVMADAGPSFMALGEGKGKGAAAQAVHAALSNPLFDAPLEGARGILFNIKGGEDLSIGQVHEVAGVVREASRAQAQVVFGVVQDRKWKKRVSITLVAAGVAYGSDAPWAEEPAGEASEVFLRRRLANRLPASGSNGHGSPIATAAQMEM